MKDGKRWMVIGGILLDVAGAATIAVSLPEGGETAAVGVGLLLAGALLISLGLEKVAGIGESGEPDEPLVTRIKRWKPEEELRAATPRRVRLAPVARVIVFAWTAMILAGAFFLWDRLLGRMPAPPNHALLDEVGLRTEAVVHDKRVRQSAEGEPKYYLYYNFEDDRGEELRASTAVRQRAFERYREGDRLEVVYLPGDAAAHYLPEITRSTESVRLALAFGVVVLGLGGVLEVQRRKHRRLVSRGATVPGVVERVSRRGSSRAYQARYEAGGHEGVIKAAERGRLVSPGDLVTVLYDAEKPAEAIVYRTSLYRAR